MELVKKPGEQDAGLSLAIFAARESLAICMRTLHAASEAMPPLGTIDILVNGNANLATSLAELLVRPDELSSATRVRVWNLPLGDKANAWNTYFHQIWAGETLAFFVDGYVRLRPDALVNLQRALDSNPSALGGSGVPTIGRSSATLRRTMLAHGGFHGNLCCVRGHVISDLRQRNIRIPLGLYRVDSLLGAILSFGLNPKDAGWDPSRVVVNAEASWDVDAKSIWRWSDWKSKRSQLERQYRGDMENAAVKYFFTVLKTQPEHLPRDAGKLLETWKHLAKDDFREFTLRHPLSALACKRYLAQTFDWSTNEVAQMIGQTGNSCSGRGEL